MPATTTLTSTTLAAELDATARLVMLASTSGLSAGQFLFVENELMQVLGLDVPSGGVNVLRGQGGTPAGYHEPGATVYAGSGDQFYRTDPVGSPKEIILVSPWINVTNGSVWFAQGDPRQGAYRFWQKQAMTPGVGPLGVRTFVYDPTSST